MSLSAVVAFGNYGEGGSLRRFLDRKNTLNIQYSFDNIQLIGGTNQYKPDISFSMPIQ